MMAPTVRADLDGSVHVTNEAGQRLVLTAGQEVPDGFEVGDHLLETRTGPRGGGDGESAPARSATRGEWESYAVSLGMSEADAAGHQNKDELVAATEKLAAGT